MYIVESRLQLAFLLQTFPANSLLFCLSEPAAMQQPIQNKRPVLKSHVVKRELFVGACLVLFFTVSNFTGSLTET